MERARAVLARRMNHALLGGVAVPVLLGTTALLVALRRIGRRRLDVPPGRVVIASNLSDSRRRRGH